MLSKHVFSILEGLSQLESKRHYNIVAYMRQAEFEAVDENDKCALSIIGRALSMKYHEDESRYSSQIGLADGNHRLGIEDITPEEIEVLKEAIPSICPSWMRAQLYEIIWLKTSEHEYAECSSKDYIAEFEATFDEDHWTTCFSMIQAAYRVSISQGKKAESFKKVYEVINSALCRMNGEDPHLLSLNLIGLVYKKATSKELNDYLLIVDKIFERNESSKNVHIMEQAFDIYCSLLNRAQKKEQLSNMRTRMAKYYESCADKPVTDNTVEAQRAIDFLLKACKLYEKNADREKVLQIRLRIRDLQGIASKNMISMPVELDVSTIFAKISKLFDGLSLQEMILQLGRIAEKYKKEDVKNKVIENQHRFPIDSLFCRGVMNSQGQKVELISPLNSQDPEGQPDILYKHMVRYVTDGRAYAEGMILSIAYRIFRDSYNVSIEDLNFMIDDNSFIPEDRREIVKLGLYLGLSGNLYAAMHILLPQTENIIRHLVEMCGDTTTFIDEQGREEHKPLSSLFSSTKLKECYDEDLLFSLQTILIERGGPNLRNLNAHGLLEPAVGNGSAALCFLCLFIKFISCYSLNAQEILEKLYKRDPNG